MKATPTAAATVSVGDKIKFQHGHSDGSMVTFFVTVIRVGNAKNGNPAALVRVPSKVQSIPFAPFGGKAEAWVDLTKVAQSSVSPTPSPAEPVAPPASPVDSVGVFMLGGLEFPVSAEGKARAMEFARSSSFACLQGETRGVKFVLRVVDPPARCAGGDPFVPFVPAWMDGPVLESLNYIA